MRKFIFFLLLLSVSCVFKPKESESIRHAKKFEKLTADANKARLDYTKKVDKKVKGPSLDRSRRKMLKTETKVEKYKNTMQPNTRHRNVTH